MGQRFRGKNVVVTGSSRGIGAGLAHRLAAEGANLALVARTLEAHPTLPGSLRQTAEICRGYGVDVHLITADLGDGEARQAIVPEALDKLGSIDILVNNAAAAIYASLLDYPLKRRRLMTEINVHAPVDLAQGVIPHMLERGSGWILNVSSATAELPDGPPFRTEGVATKIGVYGMTKAALNRITTALAVELHGSGIRVNTIEPKAAVLSEGADVLVGGSLRDDQIESLEAMVESMLILCECEPDRTGLTARSLDLLDQDGVTVMTLDGSAAYPGGQRVWKGDA